MVRRAFNSMDYDCWPLPQAARPVLLAARVGGRLAASETCVMTPQRWGMTAAWLPQEPKPKPSMDDDNNS